MCPRPFPRSFDPPRIASRYSFHPGIYIPRPGLQPLDPGLYLPADLREKTPSFFNGSPEVGLGLYTTTAGVIIGEVSGLVLIVFAIILLKKGKERVG
jgi:hypothetical protein